MAPVAVLLMAPFLASADTTIANVATPAIRHGLDASGAAVQLVVGGYLVAYAVLLITGARLGQTHGYKRLFLLGVVAFAVTSLAGGLSPDITMLIIMRVLQGAAAALMFPQALTGIQLNLTGHQRLRAIGLFATALSAGAVFGQLLGGILVSANIAGTTWRPILLVNVPICIAVLAAAPRVLPPDERRGVERVDLLGISTLSAAVLLVVVPLTIGRGGGWPAWSWISLAVSVPAGAVFVSTQRHATTRGRAPLVNIAVLARPTITWGLAALLGASGTYFALLFTVAQYLQIGLGHSALASGLILVPWVAAFGLAGQITRRLPARLAPMLPVGGFVLLATAYVAISAASFAGELSEPLLAVMFVLGGLGWGIAFTALIGHLTDAVPVRHAADISGVITTTSQLGGSIGVAALGSLYLAGAATDTPGHAFAVTTLCLGVIAMIVTLPAYLTTHGRGITEPAEG